MLRTISGLLLALLASPLIGTAADDDTHLPNRSHYDAPLANAAPVIDGVPDDRAWDQADWHPISERWLGPEYGAEDFSGRFKVVWTEERIYLLAEIVDDILIDSHRDPLVQYWDDDCLEIFLDEDRSGGDHQFNHNAFAYHISLDNRAIDIGTDKNARDYSHHVNSRWRQSDNALYWEIAIDVYADTYVDAAANNKPIRLEPAKTIGLMVAYCDNDGSELRENFVGSETVPSGPTDRGWIDAGLFGEFTLSK